MTDRTRHFTVILDQDYRVDDAQAIVDAIGMVKGVSSVEPHIRDCNDLMARVTAFDEFRRRLWDAMESLNPRNKT